MQIKSYSLLLLCVAALLFAGCRSHRKITQGQQPDTTVAATPASNPQQTGNRGANRTTKPAYTPHYYSSNFTCSAQGYNASGQMRLQSDSVIWVSGSKIVELGRAMFTPDSVIIHAKILNRCFRGNYDDMYQRFKFRTTFKQLYQRCAAPDAETQLTELFKRFGIDAELKMAPLKEVDQLTFPMAIPARVNPL